MPGSTSSCFGDHDVHVEGSGPPAALQPREVAAAVVAALRFAQPVRELRDRPATLVAEPPDAVSDDHGPLAVIGICPTRAALALERADVGRMPAHGRQATPPGLPTRPHCEEVAED